jgi:hypothetical protein
MVNNSINIIKTKESLNIKTKERLKSDGQQFNQYQQNKRKFKNQNKKLSFVLMILMELLTITV